MTNYNEYITNVISALIVYFSAFSLLIKQFLNGQINILERTPFKKNISKNKKGAN